MLLTESLIPLGWAVPFENHFNDLKLPGARPVRILREERGKYFVGWSLTETAMAEVSGKFRHEASGREAMPAVGDWVAVTSSGSSLIIHAVLPRASCLKRQAVAGKHDIEIFASNIDTVFIATSLNDEFNERRLERYLTMAWDSGAQPVVVLTKVDLRASRLSSGEPVPSAAELRTKFPDVPLLEVSAHQRQGLDTLLAQLPAGRTGVIVGSSGVGKSSLINALRQDEAIDTGGIRESDARGRHTTTSRCLHVLPGGGLLIDTPGIRELQMLEFNEGLARTFEDVESLFGTCRFTNCRHDTEPGCAIRESISKGRLGADRWESYLKLQREIAHQTKQVSPREIAEKKKRWKKVHANARVHVKVKRGEWE